MCVLCRDTFSRSDILKRHFQKCSIRRGNPTGASHLSHPHAHVKKNAAAQQKAALNQEGGDLNHLNTLNNMPTEGMVQPFGMMPQVADGMNNMQNDQNQLSRSSSMARMDNSNNQDRRGMPAPVMGTNGRGGNFEQTQYNGDVNNTMQSNMNQQMPSYNMPPNQNPMPMYGNSNPTQQSNLDWGQMFPSAGRQKHPSFFHR